jgi:uncharacterized YccA/Bax inhibitor family protein
MIARSSNPALSDKAFERVSLRTGEQHMTLSGTVNKCSVLIAILLVSATWSWRHALPDPTQPPVLPGWYFPIIIGGAILAFVMIFRPATSPYFAPVYAVSEGLLLGTVSSLYEYRQPGIVLNAVLCTVSVFVALLVLYRSGIVKPTENLKLGIVSATGAIAIVYVFDIVLRMFHIQVPFLHDSSALSIGISVVIVIVAALNFVLDFDFIERGVERGAPKYMEWYGAFGLLVTLVWLYLEILRLLSKAAKRN